MSAVELYAHRKGAVAERVQELECALADARQRLDDFAEISSDWLWETDQHLRFTRFSGRLEAATGVASLDWIGRTPSQLALAQGEAPPLHGFADMRAHRPFRNLSYAIETPRGRRHIVLNGKPVFDADGRFHGFRGTGSDVTAAVEAEHRAATIHRRFAEAIESIPASLLLCDADDRIVICNSATQRYFPKVAHLLVPGTRFEDLVRAQAKSGSLTEVSDDVEAWVAARMNRHRSAESVMTRHHDDGRWVQIIERRTSEGGIIGIRIDVTELKQREQALSEQSAKIAEYAEELERSNRELEQFAYIASHDLQEPLRMVASYCQLLQRRYRGSLDQDADEFIGFAVEGAGRMQRLINDLLTYSRVGRNGTRFELMPASAAVEAALANLKGAIAEAGASVAVGALPLIAGDRTQLVQLFQNLIGNAIKFRREEPATVRVEASEPTDEGRVRITVADNGIGIEPDYLDRVFLIFQRLHDRTKYPGTGIGLAIVKKVVENHGGRVWIESTPEVGSRFHFTLPTTISAENS
jgi:PAS domain S-box-containing protein